LSRLYGYCYEIVFFVFLLAIMYGEIATDASCRTTSERRLPLEGPLIFC